MRRVEFVKVFRFSASYLPWKKNQVGVGWPCPAAEHPLSSHSGMRSENTAGSSWKSSMSDAERALLSQSHTLGVSNAALPQLRLLWRSWTPSQTRSQLETFHFFIPFQDQGSHSLLTLKLSPWCLCLLCGLLCSSWCSSSWDWTVR